MNLNLIQNTNKINEFTQNLRSNYKVLGKHFIEGFISEEIFRYYANTSSKSIFNFLLENIAQTYVFTDSSTNF